MPDCGRLCRAFPRLEIRQQSAKEGLARARAELPDLATVEDPHELEPGGLPASCPVTRRSREVEPSGLRTRAFATGSHLLPSTWPWSSGRTRLSTTCTRLTRSWPAAGANFGGPSGRRYSERSLPDLPKQQIKAVAGDQGPRTAVIDGLLFKVILSKVSIQGAPAIFAPLLRRIGGPPFRGSSLSLGVSAVSSHHHCLSWSTINIPFTASCGVDTPHSAATRIATARGL